MNLPLLGETGAARIPISEHLAWEKRVSGWMAASTALSSLSFLSRGSIWAKEVSETTL